jgi:hypothetical protein
MKRYLLILFIFSLNAWAVDWEDLTEFPDSAYKNHEEADQRARQEMEEIKKASVVAATKPSMEEIKETPPEIKPKTSPVLEMLNEDSVPVGQSGIKKDYDKIPTEEIKPLWSFPLDRRPRKIKSR